MSQVFPLREMMLVCNGCGGERRIPDAVLATLTTVEDFMAFMKGDVSEYACRCGAKTCDVRLLTHDPIEEPKP